MERSTKLIILNGTILLNKKAGLKPAFLIGIVYFLVVSLSALRAFLFTSLVASRNCTESASFLRSILLAIRVFAQQIWPGLGYAKPVCHGCGVVSAESRLESHGDVGRIGVYDR